MSWPELGIHVRGLPSVRSFLVNCFDSVPDLKVTINNTVPQGSSPGVMVYNLSGTQMKLAFPMFPLGTWVEWKVTGKYDFDVSGKIKTHQMRFDFVPGAPVTVAQYQGLAQCARALSCTAGGSRLLQRALDMAGVEEEAKALLVEPMKHSVWHSSLSPHGNHVLQKLITTMYPHRVRFIADAFKSRAFEAAQHQMQSRILERLLECCPPDMTTGIVEEVMKHSSALLRHEFGNFVMQAVLEHGSPMHKSKLARAIAHDLDGLAKHKIGSNSVRKALLHSSEADQDLLIAAIKKDPQHYASLSKHKTGSFVVREMKHIVRARKGASN